MIHIKKNDTLIDVIEKIQSIEENEIVLKFPIWHSILHNYLSLKIIKSKSYPKKITIITRDIISRKIGKKLWIHYSIIHESFWSEDENELWIMKHNFSFREYLVFELKKYYQEFLNILKRNKQINNIKKYSKKYKSYSNIWLFVGLLLISIFLFVFIFYFAINKTTIIITPEITVKKKARNFTFTESSFFEVIWSDKNIIIEPIEEKIELSEIYSTTWIDEQSMKKSRGKVRLSNTLNQEIKLLPSTRLVTGSWIVFETTSWISIPAAIVDNFWETIPGETDLEVIAKNYDTEWNFIGERGNIEKQTLLTLPWLNDNGETIFATTLENFSGGDDNYTSKISEDDIKNSTLIFEQKLKNELIKKLKEKVSEMNNLDKTSFEILTIDNIIEYSNTEIRIQDGLKIWDNSKNIVLEWSIIWKTYIYDRSNVINKLKTVVQENILEWVESILLIDESSLRISSIISRKDTPLEVKATVEIDTLISHDFDDTNNVYTKKLKSTIRGMDRSEAIKILLNDPKISNAEIVIRPFFLRKVSNISENIYFQIEEN